MHGQKRYIAFPRDGLSFILIFISKMSQCSHFPLWKWFNIIIIIFIYLNEWRSQMLNCELKTRLYDGTCFEWSVRTQHWMYTRRDDCRLYSLIHHPDEKNFTESRQQVMRMSSIKQTGVCSVQPCFFTSDDKTINTKVFWSCAAKTAWRLHENLWLFSYCHIKEWN